jgi:hypothetical protein
MKISDSFWNKAASIGTVFSLGCGSVSSSNTAGGAGVGGNLSTDGATVAAAGSGTASGATGAGGRVGTGVAGNTSAGGTSGRTIIGSCFMSHPPDQAPTCSDEFDPNTTTKLWCKSAVFKWSDLPCPTASRVGSCDLGDSIIRYYTDTQAPSGDCFDDGSCTGPAVIGQCLGAPIVAIPHSCVAGKCDYRDTPESDAFACCFDCEANPQNPFPAVCSAWTLN